MHPIHPNKQRNVAVAVFEDRSRAQAALGELRRAGFGEEEIGIIARNGENLMPSEISNAAVEHSRLVEGAAAGLATGASVGALWALGIAAGMLPAVGPIIAGGLLASLAASAAGGAAIGGLVGSLIGLGIPEEEAAGYETHFIEGRTIVTVKTDSRYAEAVQIMETHGGHVSFPYNVRKAAETDLDERDADVVTRGTRPADIDAHTSAAHMSRGDFEPAGVGGAGLGKAEIDRASDITQPFSELMDDDSEQSARSRQSTTSSPDSTGEDIDTPIGTGEPMRPEDPLKFDHLAPSAASTMRGATHIGQRLAPSEPVRASDQQNAAGDVEPLMGEEPRVDAGGRATRRTAAASQFNPGETTEMPTRTSPEAFDRADVSNRSDTAKTAGERPTRGTPARTGNEFDRPA